MNAAAAVRIIGAAQRRCAQSWRRPALLLPPVVSSSAVQCCLQSTQPVPARRLPYRVKVSAGKRYAWCACGHSKKQPFCDGAHRTVAPSISPLRFTPEKDQALLLCACKQTKNAPYCDGSHLKVIFRDAVKSVKGLFK
ncbi:CDGSH iron-sulfur domain-containing protein 3, mitochondrial-like [Stegastes partitus]|uniref:CDGSH iron sulfur domain 3 n=1 Tax=Stegastes partitus TaxID=144197 RepID=A0A3B4Z2J9_9TELE|nr:PREDICTED: CDGSH iron-sulfur domain-containing protein 3, mitochondrial-like [Stegastes partitus]